MPLSRVLVALGVGHVGSEVAELLARHFGNIDSLMAATEEDLTEIPSIGPKIAATLVAYFENESNQCVLEKLRRAGVAFEDESRREPEQRMLEGLRFVLTGRLQHFSRSQIEERIKGQGGVVSGSVSGRTDYLVSGEDAGSKLADAERLGIKTLTEEEFLILSEKGPKV